MNIRSPRIAPLTALVIGTVTIAGLATVARAQPSTGPRSVTVHFEDLDIDNTHGAAVLYRRIKIAAEDVCSALTYGRSLSLLVPYENCVQGAIETAVAKVNQPRLTEYAMARGVTPAGPPIKVKVAHND